MRNFKKTITTLALCVAIVGTQWINVNAADEANTPENAETQSTDEAEYDLEEGGKQVFVVNDEDGEETEIVIEEVPGAERVANGTYKISKTKSKTWTAGFYVKISSNRITKSYGAFYKAIKGTITKSSLKKESDVESVLSFYYNYSGDKKTCGLKAKILNKKLIASAF